MRLLVIEDECDFAEALAKGLRHHGFAVDVASTGEQGRALAMLHDYDLLILDLNLPGMDGLEVCRQLHATRPSLLILMLTVRSRPEERVVGLDLGADDYLVKPFHFPELLARIRALLRRDTRVRPLLLDYADVKLDPSTRIAWQGNHRLDLTSKEFGILEYLLRHQGEIVSQEALLEHVWDMQANPFTNTVRVHVNSLRRKLGDLAETPRYIETVIGQGYRLGPPRRPEELSGTFEAMLERLERTFEQQRRFVEDIAHELRAPLASLRTSLEVVAADQDATLDDYRKMVATQERALTRLERLVAALLLLAKSEHPPSRSEVTLESLLEEVIGELKQAAATREVRVQLITKAQVVIPADEALLARVFSNLIENAIHYNHPGGEVVVTIDRKDARAVVTVADTGIGIPAEEQAHIFERFYRVDSSRARHQGGAGLGLSIVAAIVQQHGGQVHVESTPAAGSTFTVLLPM